MNKRKEQNTLTFSQKIADQKYDTLQSLMENWKKNKIQFYNLTLTWFENRLANSTLPWKL